MFNWFKRSQKQEVQKPVKKKHRRAFVGAFNTRNNHFNTTFAKINTELREDLIALDLRARALVKNNETVASYINLMLRSVLGDNGFTLNCTAYNDDGTSDVIANQIIEDHWYEYTRSWKNYVSADEQSNGLDLDRQILFNYLVDGEVFLRIHRDSKSKYGVRFQLIDALDVDILYTFQGLIDGYRTCMGVKVDEKGKPVSYFIRKNRSLDFYLAGERQEVPASEIIHIYRKTFANQVRGYPILAPVLLNLNSLEQFKRSEINSSILNSCFMGVWTRANGGTDAFDQYDENEIDEQGDVAVELQSNVFRFAPDGYNLNQIASNHPNPNSGNFFKSMLKGAAGALGLSYNKLASDYQSVNYSSLRQANMQDELTVKELQRFIIDHWKEHQFAIWLRYLLLSDLTNLPYSKINKFESHQFTGRNFQYLDPAKQMQAVQMRLALGLSSPIEQITNLGKDPVDVLNSWQKWVQMLKNRGLKISNTMQLISSKDDELNDNEENKTEQIIDE